MDVKSSSINKYNAMTQKEIVTYVIEECCKQYGVTTESLQSTSRDEYITSCRDMVVYILFNNLRMHFSIQARYLDRTRQNISVRYFLVKEDIKTNKLQQLNHKAIIKKLEEVLDFSKITTTHKKWEYKS